MSTGFLHWIPYDVFKFIRHDENVNYSMPRRQERVSRSLVQIAYFTRLFSTVLEHERKSGELRSVLALIFKEKVNVQSFNNSKGLH